METKDIQTVIDLAASVQDCVWPGDDKGAMPYVVLPSSYTVHDLERLLPSPTRKRCTVRMDDADSFIAYIKKHGSLAECVIYADMDSEASSLTMTAVLNDHSADQPAWRDHRCLFAPKLSLEWKRWVGMDRKAMSQTEFAGFLEDNLREIAKRDGMPSGSDMLSMALGFSANADKKLHSKVSLQSGGVRMTFVDDENKETKSSMEVFGRFALGIPVFSGAASAYAVEARLKYRVESQAVKFWYELIRPDRVYQTAAHEVLGKIKDASGFMLLHGTP